MKISVIITLKKDVLDPQGKVIHQTLDGMGFNDVNEVYGSYIAEGHEPARETIAVKTLPMKVNVEISMIAIN